MQAVAAVGPQRRFGTIRRVLASSCGLCKKQCGMQRSVFASGSRRSLKVQVEARVYAVPTLAKLGVWTVKFYA